MGKYQAARGFSFLELTVVVAIVVALAAVVIPMVSEARRDAELAQVFETIERARSAVVEFHRDTGRCAEEHDGRRDLSELAAIPGWKGPYWERGPDAHPHRGLLAIHGTLSAALMGGFDLLGRGSLETWDRGNFLRLGNIPEKLARSVDATLDRGIAGDWNRTGRVQWRQGTLDVFLFAAHDAPPESPR